MQARKGRPEPVSCQLCRSKKLRCNRVQPCSNCESRHVPCHFLIPPTRNQRGRTPELQNNTEILARIERLEAIVLAEGTNGRKCPDSHITLTPYSEDSVQYDLRHGRDEDLTLLENVGVREDSLISSLSGGLAFTTRSVDEILEEREYSQNPSLASRRYASKIIITLPTYKTAVKLFDCFDATVDHMCRILHLPTVKSLMKTSYIRVNRNESIPSGQAALLLSLFALSAFFYQHKGDSESVDIENATTRLSKYWSRGALDVLEYSARNTSGTLEDIQALILMTYVTYHLDGFSARYRNLLAMAVSMARDLGLHRLDANDGTSASKSSSLRDLIDYEVKRRVYWHLIASDWAQSTMSGPQEGTYLIHPNHFQVRLPKDDYDESITLGSESESTIEQQPTGITFLLARIRLAQLSREYTDTIPLQTSQLMKVPYEHIIALDQKLKDFLAELPYFFRLDEESRQKSKHLEAVYTKIPMMRYCILAAAHSRRCRSHQKFLIRAASDPRYAYSRQACLESARAVIQLYEEPKTEGESPSMETARMAMAVHYTHLALVILVMDLCFNKHEADHEERKREVLATLQVLEGARTISPLLNRSLDSVVEVLRKHRVYLAGEALTGDGQYSRTTRQDDESSAYPFEDAEKTPPWLDPDAEGSLTIDPSINEFWQNVSQFEMDFDTSTWDTLFSSLDSRPF
ncbi:hypothetical protein O1611_g6274 [Lasiodiplodia mahajangana]|uniref:Uncharacterized protein n=1 Tax=Lasiodiplodia mahajangana TaxID=1108764 RepID=A0ACC2JJA5_9PEZI|nr:hypothetical protein O1611_g6274 [Lasiodiplodia mahajangana]